MQVYISEVRGVMMKRILSTILCIGIIFTSSLIFAAPVDFWGGVRNEYEYEEYVFITGEPIKFVGKVDVSEKYKEKNNTLTVTYKFTLQPEDASMKGKLSRKMTYVTEYTKREDKGQAIGKANVTKYSETIDLNKDRYRLENYQFSKSDVIDERPASHFYSGNMKGKKFYSVNKNEGNVVVDMTGGDVGYENFWGSTETQIINFIITYPNNEQGLVKVQTSDSENKKLKYSDNEVDYISFNGGYIRTTNKEAVSKIDYDLPGGRGTKDLSKKMTPKVERLIVPKFRDLGGHWAEEYIEKLYSLDVFDDTSKEFFVPEANISRKEFITSLMKGCNIEIEVPEKKRSKKDPPERSPFRDISTKDKDYYYIKEAYNREIIKGRTIDLFRPNEPLTMAEGVSMLIRALGFETKAPSPGYYTSFLDDKGIPNWAKDSAYVAKEIGILEGNRMHPNKPLTRAEASKLLVRFLEFLEKDLQKDYRENIILFN